MASSVAVSQACSAVTISMRSGSAEELVDSLTEVFKNDMPLKPKRLASSAERATNSARVSTPVTVPLMRWVSPALKYAS